jgi:hypothetical protein
LRCFFFARRDLRCSTFGDLAIIYAPDAHWVRREVEELDFEKTWTHKGLGPLWCSEGNCVTKSTSNSSLQMSVVWQLKAYETVLDWVKALQWTLSLGTSCSGGKTGLVTSLFFFLRSLRQPCSVPWRWKK